MSRIWLVFSLLALCPLLAFGSFSPPSGTRAAPLSIDIASLTPFFYTLPVDERDEQLRDWAVYGLKNSLDLEEGAEMPVRHPALAATGSGEISAGRVFVISPTEWGVLLPPELLGSKPLLGGLIDRKHAGCNSLPEKIHLYSYTANPASTAITVTTVSSVAAHDLFTPEYGYYSARVGTLADLQGFLQRVDDLTSVSWRSGTLTLGGRKYLPGDRRALGVQELAALYQAYNPPVLPAGLRERLVQERYEQLLRDDARLKKELKRGRIKKAQVLRQIRRQIRRQISPPPSESQVGFSLDPQFDYPGLAQDLRKLISHHSGSLPQLEPYLAEVLSRNRAEIGDCARRLETRHDLRPLLTLRRRLESSPHDAELRLAATLSFLESRHSYQNARYDGNLQGTSAGMILFYTDLLAKLWALDYQGLAPKGTVKGFRPMQQIPVPKLEWADFLRLSKTRLWFGLRSEGFDIYGDQLLFQPVATRVYAASSDPMFPGKESEPNYQSKAFLGWWDRHYQAVADVEPSYHKLDQIQKWSCVFMVLKEKKSHLMDFLQRYPVRHDFDFEAWVKQDPALARIEIPFLDRHSYGRSTECLPLLRSQDYRLMGKHYVLSGGVSLASRKDILAKLHKGTGGAAHEEPGATEAGQTARRGGGKTAQKKVAGVPSHAAGAGAGAGAAAAAGAGAGAGAGAAGIPAPSRAVSARPGRPGRQTARLKGQAQGDTGSGAAAHPARRPGGDGSFTAHKEEGGAIRLSWEKGPTLAQHELVASLAALQQADSQGNKGEHIFDKVGDLRSVVRLKEWGAYLVKTGASGDQWIYLAVNPEKIKEYPAKAAAAYPDADIFGARLLSDAAARKLAAGKPMLR